MAFTPKGILGPTVPGFMSLGLMGRSLRMVPQDWGPKGLKKHSKNFKKTYIGGFADVSMGIPMVGIVSNQISALP